MKSHTSIIRIMAAFGAAMIFYSTSAAQEASSDALYQTPPDDIAALYLAKPLPKMLLSPDGETLAITRTDCQWRDLDELLSCDEHCLAGLRIDAHNYSPTRHNPDITAITLQSTGAGGETAISGMPQPLSAFDLKWSSDGRYLAFLNRTAGSVDLYRVDVHAGRAVKVNDRRVNATLSFTYALLPDGSVLYKAVPENAASLVSRAYPRGPVMQHSERKKGTFRTVQNVIRSADDEADFDALCTSELRLWNGSSSRTAGSPAVIKECVPSPDGKYLLTVTEHRPYSYTRSHNYFPTRQTVSDLDGNVLVVTRELKDPKDTLDKDRAEDSGFEWRADMPATLCFTRTLPAPKDTSKSDGKPERTYVTSLWQCSYPFDLSEGAERILTSEYKLGKVMWCTGDFAIYTDSSSKQKIRRTLSFNPSDTTSAPVVLYQESTAPDSLGTAPAVGKPYLTSGPYGRDILYRNRKDGSILLTGTNRPDDNGDRMSFIDRLDLRTLQTSNLWTGAAPYREEVLLITDASTKGVSFISRRQSAKQVPNCCRIESRGRKVSYTYVTDFENPLPQLSSIKDTLITYYREDGVRLTSRLFLPAGYDPATDGRLPVIMWTYPYEYQTAAEAQKYREDRYTFPVPTRNCHIGWATRGYAVMQGFSMPIIAPAADGQSNDDFRNQIVMNARAAVHAADSLGFGDTTRVAVGGHSYGSFMTANLMEHTDLFKAGLAESGAFNRTLTPFGFQSEERSYWEAKEVYDAMSPFNYPDKLTGHILLVHGTMDENTGTHPIQSERMFQAFAGAGKDADYLQLPYEGHGYIFKDNMLHLINEEWKMWEKYLKNAE